MAKTNQMANIDITTHSEVSEIVDSLSKIIYEDSIQILTESNSVIDVYSTGSKLMSQLAQLIASDLSKKNPLYDKDRFLRSSGGRIQDLVKSTSRGYDD